MVIELDEQKMDKAMYTIEQRTRFMISAQVLTLLAVLTIVGFHSRVVFDKSIQLFVDLPVLPCITTTILVGICIFYQIQRTSLNYLRTKLLCTYFKDGKIVMED
jgi:hypothetical protein